MRFAPSRQPSARTRMAKELLIEYVMKSPLFKHRSIRKFKNRPIPDDTLREIL